MAKIKKIDWDSLTFEEIKADPQLFEKYINRKHPAPKKFKFIPSPEVIMQSVKLMENKFNYFIKPELKSGKVSINYEKLWDIVIKRYKEGLPLYRYSTMRLLSQTFYEEKLDRSFLWHTSNEPELYAELKSFFIYHRVLELLSDHAYSPEDTIEKMFEFYGLGCEWVLQQVFKKNFLPVIEEKFFLVLGRLFFVESLDRIKDEPLDKIYFYTDAKYIKRFKLHEDFDNPGEESFYMYERSKLLASNFSWDYILSDPSDNTNT